MYQCRAVCHGCRHCWLTLSVAKMTADNEGSCVAALTQNLVFYGNFNTETVRPCGCGQGRLVVDMKFYIYTHIYIFSVDIHGYIHNIDDYPVYMYRYHI